jgi:signal peptidase I
VNVTVLSPLVGAIVFVALMLGVVRRLYSRATVRGESMTPTFADGEVVTVRLRPKRPYTVGDVVVFSTDSTQALGGDPLCRIKRIAAVAGDPLPSWLADHAVFSEGTVPPDHVVVNGDNPQSETSSHLGYIPISAVIGVVRAR